MPDLHLAGARITDGRRPGLACRQSTVRPGRRAYGGARREDGRTGLEMR